MREFIKNLLRENLSEIESKNKEKENSDSYETDYKEIQRMLNHTMIKKSNVMQAAGMGRADDATARSLFNRKLNRAANEEGSHYSFNPDELTKLKQILSNPNKVTTKQSK